MRYTYLLCRRHFGEAAVNPLKKDVGDNQTGLNTKSLLDVIKLASGGGKLDKEYPVRLYGILFG